MLKVVIFILYFFFYSFIGWIVESTYCSFGEKKLINRGFLTGPIVPIYGAGTLTMAVCLTPIKNLHFGFTAGEHFISLSTMLVFFAGIIVCDIVEFITSYVMEKLFHARWWDYSNKKFNIQGRICLQHSIYWGVGSVIFLYFIHPITEYCFSRLIDEVAYIACPIFLIIFIIDVIHATIKAMDVKKFMDKMSKAYSVFSNAKDEIKNGVKSNAKSSVSYIGSKYESAKAKVDAWRKDTYNQLKNMLPSFSNDDDNKKDKKKELPNHHFKSYPALLNYAKDQFKKVDDLIEDIKKSVEGKNDK